jgi:uncharacterized protein (DUF1810 family)
MSDLQRYVKRHEYDYDIALQELKAGEKQSHWIWSIFPQIQGLGFSPMTVRYAINDLKEAKAYMEHPTLKEHMLEICSVLLLLDSNDASIVMGYPDDLKLKSSMTLFSISNPEIDVFQKILDKFFNGEKDEKTIEILERLQNI